MPTSVLCTSAAPQSSSFSAPPHPSAYLSLLVGRRFFPAPCGAIGASPPCSLFNVYNILRFLAPPREASSPSHDATPNLMVLATKSLMAALLGSRKVLAMKNLTTSSRWRARISNHTSPEGGRLCPENATTSRSLDASAQSPCRCENDESGYGPGIPPSTISDPTCSSTRGYRICKELFLVDQSLQSPRDCEVVLHSLIAGCP